MDLLDILHLSFLVTALIAGFWAFYKWIKLDEMLLDNTFMIETKEDFEQNMQKVNNSITELRRDITLLTIENRKLRKTLEENEDKKKT